MEHVRLGQLQKHKKKNRNIFKKTVSFYVAEMFNLLRVTNDLK